MTHQQMWAAYCRAEPAAAGCAYEAWAFGGAPDKLAELARAGVKTATASAWDCYQAEGEPLPRAGGYSVILDSADRAVCVIRTTKVYTVPFSQVSPRHAWKEGEGDRSLAYWRKVHEDLFRRELAAIGNEFTEDMPVVCEEFEIVFPNE